MALVSRRRLAATLPLALTIAGVLASVACKKAENDERTASASAAGTGASAPLAVTAADGADSGAIGAMANSGADRADTGATKIGNPATSAKPVTAPARAHPAPHGVTAHGKTAAPTPAPAKAEAVATSAPEPTVARSRSGAPPMGNDDPYGAAAPAQPAAKKTPATAEDPWN